MLHFPKEASQHRDHLIFSLDLVALPARAVVFERLNVAVVFDGAAVQDEKTLRNLRSISANRLRGNARTRTPARSFKLVSV
jgi:hypothetical protein